MKKLLLAVVVLLSGCSALQSGTRAAICKDAGSLATLAESGCQLAGKSLTTPKLTLQDLCNLARTTAARKDEFCAGA